MSEPKKISELLEMVKTPVYQKNLAESELKRKREEEKKKEDDFNYRLKMCGIPKIFSDASFQNWKTDTKERIDVLNIARRYVSYTSNVRKVGAVLTGKTGTGKSRMAINIARALMESGSHVMFLMSLEIDSKLEKSAYTVEYLIIDDIGLADTDYATKNAIMKLIARRYYNGAVTIITTNNEGDELSEQFNKAILFRIGSNAVTIDFSKIKNKRTEEAKTINDEFNNYEVK